MWSAYSPLITPLFKFHNFAFFNSLSDVMDVNSTSLPTFLRLEESGRPPCSAQSVWRNRFRSLRTGSIRVRPCEQRGSSWPRCWPCLPQCPGRRARSSMTSWAASPGGHRSWSSSMSTSTWTGWSDSSWCRVGKQLVRYKQAAAADRARGDISAFQCQTSSLGTVVPHIIQLDIQ